MKDKEDSRDNLIKLIEYEMVSTYEAMLKDLENMQGCIDFINNNCLSKYHTTLVKYLDDIIEDEKKNEEDGFPKRTRVLKNLIKSVKETHERKTNIFDTFKQATKEDKLQQAKQCYMD